MQYKTTMVKPSDKLEACLKSNVLRPDLNCLTVFGFFKLIGSSFHRNGAATEKGL